MTGLTVDFEPRGFKLVQHAENWPRCEKQGLVIGIESRGVRSTPGKQCRRRIAPGRAKRKQQRPAVFGRRRKRRRVHGGTQKRKRLFHRRFGARSYEMAQHLLTSRSFRSTARI